MLFFDEISEVVSDFVISFLELLLFCDGTDALHCVSLLF